MKIISCSLLLGLSALLPLHAQSLNSNTVGLVRVSIPAETFTFVSVPFKLAAGGEKLAAIVGNQLTGGTSASRSDNIIAWNAELAKYETFWKVQGSGNVDYDGKWFQANTLTPASLTLSAGSGFWVVSRQKSPQQLVLAGEVPDQNLTVALPEGLKQIGFPYPVAMSVNQPENGISAAATGGASTSQSDQIILWDAETQSHVTLWKVQGTGNPNYDEKWFYANTLILANITLDPARGFWFKRNHPGDATWTPVKPYHLE